MIDYIDAHRDEFGVEPICNVLQVAPSTYYSAGSRPVSAWSVRDAMLMPILLTLWVANRKVYGAQKLWKAARRAGHDIGRDQVVRLMRELAIEGVSRRRKKVFTTRSDPDAWRAPDLVDRNFTAAAPNRLWVTDLSRWNTEEIEAVAHALNSRPRKTLGWKTPAEALDEHLRSLQQAGVASTD